MSDLEKLAGIVASDGHIKRNKFRLVIINKDKFFINEVVSPLIAKFAKKTPKPIFNKSQFGSGKFLLFVNSKLLWSILQKKFNIPSGKKSANLKPPVIRTNQGKLDFIAGYFAGDGSVTFFRGRPRLEIWSRSKDLLCWIRSVLEENKIQSSLCSVKKKKQFLLDIKRLESVKRFHKNIVIPHPNKEQKLETLLQNF